MPCRRACCRFARIRGTGELPRYALTVVDADAAAVDAPDVPGHGVAMAVLCLLVPTTSYGKPRRWRWRCAVDLLLGFGTGFRGFLFVPDRSRHCEGVSRPRRSSAGSAAARSGPRRAKRRLIDARFPIIKRLEEFRLRVEVDDPRVGAVLVQDRHRAGARRAVVDLGRENQRRHEHHRRFARCALDVVKTQSGDALLAHHVKRQGCSSVATPPNRATSSAF